MKEIFFLTILLRPISSAQYKRDEDYERIARGLLDNPSKINDYADYEETSGDSSYDSSIDLENSSLDLEENSYDSESDEDLAEYMDTKAKGIVVTRCLDTT